MFPRGCRPGGGLMSSELLTLFIEFIWGWQEDRRENGGLTPRRPRAQQNRAEWSKRRKCKESEKYSAVSWHFPAPLLPRHFFKFVFCLITFFLFPFPPTHFVVKVSQQAITRSMSGRSWNLCMSLVMLVVYIHTFIHICIHAHTHIFRYIRYIDLCCSMSSMLMREVQEGNLMWGSSKTKQQMALVIEIYMLTLNQMFKRKPKILWPKAEIKVLPYLYNVMSIYK